MVHHFIICLIRYYDNMSTMSRGGGDDGDDRNPRKRKLSHGHADSSPPKKKRRINSNPLTMPNITNPTQSATEFAHMRNIPYSALDANQQIHHAQIRAQLAITNPALVTSATTLNTAHHAQYNPHIQAIIASNQNVHDPNVVFANEVIANNTTPMNNFIQLFLERMRLIAEGDAIRNAHDMWVDNLTTRIDTFNTTLLLFATMNNITVLFRAYIQSLAINTNPANLATTQANIITAMNNLPNLQCTQYLLVLYTILYN